MPDRAGNYERLTRAKVTRVLEKCDMQEEGMHAQMVGHAYAGMAAGLARAVAAMCNRRPIKVRLPELALDQAADLLAGPDGMCAAYSACDRYLHKAVALAHALWDAAARRVDAARPDSVTVSLRCHREERREEQQRMWEQERRAERRRCEAMERQQATQRLAAERR